MKKQQTFQTEEYKQTELGELPKEWGVVKLNDLDLDISDGNYAANYPKQKDFVNRGIPFIRANNIKNLKVVWQGMKYITKEKHSELKKGHLKKGDILITTRGDLGNLAIVSDDFIDCNINAQLVRINPLEKLDSKFLLYFLASYKIQQEIQGLKTGTALPQLPVGKLKTIPILLPPLPEQQKIVYVLSTVQNAQEKTENFINSLKEFKKSAMKHLFTYGAVPFDEIDKVELKETEIGMMPKSWEVVKLGNITETYSGGTPNRGKKQYWDKGNIPWAKSGELGDSRINLVEEKITQEGLENSSAKYVEVGDLLVAMYGATAGKVGLAQFKFTINQAICGIKPNENFNSEFYFYYLISIRDKLLSQRFGGAQPNINQQIIKSLMIPNPIITEQQRIASILSVIDEKIQAEEQKKEALKEIFNSLLKNLMTAKIRVNNLEVGV